jgi:hypothetical protein
MVGILSVSSPVCTSKCLCESMHEVAAVPIFQQICCYYLVGQRQTMLYYVNGGQSQH